MSGPATIELEQEREALTDEDVAKARHSAARADWKAACEAEVALRNQHVLTSAKLSGAGPPLGAAASEVERARISDWKLAAAIELEAAGKDLHGARIAVANAELPSLLERHRSAADALERRRDVAERACAAAIAEAAALHEAMTREAALAREVHEVAHRALANDDERAKLAHSAAARRLPARLEVDGVAEWVERPSPALFNGYAVGDERLWTSLGKLGRLGPRAVAALPKGQLSAAIRQAQSEVDA